MAPEIPQDKKRTFPRMITVYLYIQSGGKPRWVYTGMWRYPRASYVPLSYHNHHSRRTPGRAHRGRLPAGGGCSGDVPGHDPWSLRCGFLDNALCKLHIPWSGSGIEWCRQQVPSCHVQSLPTRCDDDIAPDNVSAHVIHLIPIFQVRTALPPSSGFPILTHSDYYLLSINLLMASPVMTVEEATKGRQSFYPTQVHSSHRTSRPL